jgi:Flp pilus assembly protein TadD
MALMWATAALTREPITTVAAGMAPSFSLYPGLPSRPKPSAAPAPAPATPDASEAEAPSCERLLSERGDPFGKDLRAAMAFARRGIVRGDLAAAELGYCAANRIVPTGLAPVVGLTRVLLMQEAPRAAAQWAEQATLLAPADPDVLALFGDALARAGRTEEAESAWLRAAGIAPDDPGQVERWVERQRANARRAMREQRFELAERQFRRVVSAKPEDCGARAGISRAQLGRGAVHQSVASARDAASVAPHCAEIMVVLGTALASAGDRTGAQEALRQARELDPKAVR